MKMTIDDITPNRKLSHHYFTHAPKLNPNEKNERWHCPFCEYIGTWEEIIDHVIDSHKNDLKDFMRILKNEK